jgi:hypothetical protein
MPKNPSIGPRRWQIAANRGDVRLFFGAIEPLAIARCHRIVL